MSEQLKAGQKINNYEILKVLGQSEIATVYLAKDEVLGRKWVVKEIQYTNQDSFALSRFKSNFLNTCRRLAVLKHNSINRLVDFFVTDDNKFFVVREYLEGRTLQEFLDSEQQLSEEQLKSWAKQIFNILEYLHAQKPPILMGVIVPKNLILSPMGKIRLMDLGVTRFFPDEKQKEILKTISPGYVPPEVHEDDMPLDNRSDIYSLGAMLYYFLSEGGAEKEYDGVDSYFRSDISQQTREILRKALTKIPEGRFSTIKEFKNTLLSSQVSQQPRISASIDSISIDDITPGKLVQGSFELKNEGKGFMEGAISAEYPWLKVFPEVFSGNSLTVRYWIDTDYMPSDSTQDNTITIQTSNNEEIGIPVKVELKPEFLHRIGPVAASLLLYLIPFVMFFSLEFLRLFLIKNAWQLLLLNNFLLNKGIDYVISADPILIQKTAFSATTTLLSKIYGFLLITLPYLIPLAIGKLRERFSPSIIKTTLYPAAFAMIMPALLLITFSILKIIPDQITLNISMKYLALSRYIPAFVFASLLTTTLMLAPRDNQNMSFIDRNKTTKFIFYSALVAYFVYTIIVLVTL